MFELKETHVYELTLPEHFDHVEVIRLGECKLRIELIRTSTQ